MSRFTWLHLSDWHQKESDSDRDVVIKALLDDIKKLTTTVSELGKVDAVFFTGDLAHSGLKAQYELAQKTLLDPVLSALGLGKDRLFIVPGNHDLDRNRFKLLPEALMRPFANHDEQKEWFADEEVRDTFLKPFRDYSAFSSEYRASGFPALAESRFLDVDGRSVGIIGLNTALMCARNKGTSDEPYDYGFLSVGEQQILRPLEQLEPCVLRFGLMHHHFNWLTRFDRDIVERRLMGGLDIILQGHGHSPAVFKVEGTTGQATIVPAGAGYDGRAAKEPLYTNAYNLASIDLETGDAVVHLRRWAADNTRWKRDDETAPEGKWEFCVPRLAAPAVRTHAAAATLDINSVQSAYLDYIARHCADVDPRGIRQTVTNVSLPLDQVYVSLSVVQDRKGIPIIDPHEEMEAEKRKTKKKCKEPEEAQLRAIRERVTIDLPSALSRSSKVVVLGDPGAGKTTMMRFLAAIHAKALNEGSETPTDVEGNRYGQPRLPLLVRLADYALALKDKADLDLLTFIVGGFTECGHRSESMRPLIETRLNEGNVLVLLDGLDEAIDPAVRTTIAERIRRFCSGIGSGVQVVVTSRIAGYSKAPMGAGFETYTLRDMDRSQVAKFLERWCLAVEKVRSKHATEDELKKLAQAQIDGILKSVDSNDGVRRLAANPLLLTILALIHRDGKQLPRRRVELYKLAVQTLLRDWRADKPGLGDDQIDDWTEQNLLAPLAYYMHENYDNGLVPEDEARVFLVKQLAKARNKPANDPDISREADAFLRRVRESSGVFVERAPGQFAFMHLTFEEYFASRYLVRDPYEAIPHIHGLRHQSRWEEPIRLAIADQTVEFATKLIECAILGLPMAVGGQGLGPSEHEDILCRDLFLAVRCLGDAVGVRADLGEEVADRLVDLAVGGGGGMRLWNFVGMARSLLPSFAGSCSEGYVKTKVLAWANDESEYVRANAASALASFGVQDEHIVSALLEMLSDKSEDVRGSAAIALGSLGVQHGRIVTALLALLNDESLNVRRNAVSALRSFGVQDERIVTALLEMLSVESVNMRENTASALVSLGVQDERIVTVLLALLSDESVNVRDNAAFALVSLGVQDDRIVTALLEMLSDESVNMREDATLALVNLGVQDERIMAALLALLSDESDFARARAAYALGTIGVPDERVVKALLGLAKDRQRHVRLNAASTLARYAALDERLVTALLGLAQDESDNGRASAASALGTLTVEDHRVVPTLLGLLNDDVEDVRFLAVWALEHLGVRGDDYSVALRALLSDESADVQVSAASALARIGVQDECIVETLLAALNNESDGARAHAVSTLGTLGIQDNRVVSALLGLLNDESSYIRLCTAAELANMGECIPQVVETMRAMSEQVPDLNAEQAWKALWDLYEGEKLIHVY